jgi:hypothetical protein
MVEKFKRQRHVFERGHGRHQVEGLEHNPDIGGTETGKTVLVEGGVIDALHGHAPARCTLEPGNDHEQRRFARPGGTHHGDGVAHSHAEVDAAQDRDRPRARRQCDMHVFEQNGRLLF